MPIEVVIQDLLQITGWTQGELAHQLKVQQPTISRWLKGSEPKLRQRAKIFEIAQRYNIAGDASSHNLELTVPVVGFIGGVGQVSFFADGKPNTQGARMPPASSGGSSDGLVAVVARGDSMAGQIEDGWTVYYDKNHPQQPEQLIGKLCVVQVRGGPVLIKKVLPGRRPDVFTLISLNASPMLDQVIDWASRVSWIAPN